MKPLLANKKVDLDNLIYPLLATPKLDGIRCIYTNDAYSRKLELIPNVYIRNSLSYLTDKLDGELICGNNFNQIQSLVMSEDGTPDFKFYVFDCFNNPNDPYEERVKLIKESKFIVPILPVPVNNKIELDDVIKLHLDQGHEGTMIRDPKGIYKFGRSTPKDRILTAIKPFEDGEAVVIGFEELMINLNPKELDNLGNSKRSTKKDNLVPGGTLGAFICKLDDGQTFKIGTFKNLTYLDKKEIWNNREKYIGKIVHFRYQKHGMKNKPRIPTFYGFRDLKDIS